MYTQSNKLLGNFSRVIKPYACSIIATEGPNILSKVDLAGVEIPYDTQYTTRIVLNPNTKDQPLHGYFDNNVTFLLLKVTYDETNPKCIVEESQYIEYYYSDSPSQIRYVNKLMILSGNSLKRIPRIYFNNPTDAKVVIDAMVGNLPESDLTSGDVNTSTTLNNLYHNSLISDTILNSTTQLYGSTQLKVLDYDNAISLYLDYIEIDTITVDKDYYMLTITTKSDTIINLVFLSQFEMYQAHSRLEWVIKNNLNRYLTTDYPTIDTTPPVIETYDINQPIVSNIYVMPIVGDQNVFIISKSDIITKFVYSINDERDGNINIYDSVVNIRKYSELQKINEITEIGVYDILISTTDIANNTSFISDLLIVDNIPPVINFSVTGDTFNMSLVNDSSNILSGITHSDIINKTVSSTSDNIHDMLISVSPNYSGITVSTTTVIIHDSFDALIENITISGTYTITYTETDLCGNISVYTKTLIVI